VPPKPALQEKRLSPLNVTREKGKPNRPPWQRQAPHCKRHHPQIVVRIDKKRKTDPVKGHDEITKAKAPANGRRNSSLNCLEIPPTRRATGNSYKQQRPESSGGMQEPQPPNDQ
jgi:hypothetical protein